MTGTLTGPVPGAGPLEPASLPVVAERALPSGLRVQAARRAGVAMVELRLRIPWGGAAGADLAQAALLAESIMSGTRSHDRVAFASALQALGGSLSASATVERLTIGGSAISANLEDLLALVAGILTTPAYSAHEVERDRSRLRERLAVAASQPARQARDALLHRMYPGHPYGRELPEPEAVARVDAIAVADLHGREVAPTGALLVLVGDLDPETALDRAEAVLGGWSAGADGQRPMPPGVRPPSVTSPGPLLLVDRPGSVQTSVRVGGAAVPRTDPAYPALKLANLLFGGYFSSRLVANLRERRGYTYSPRSGIEHAAAASRLVISADVATEVTAPGLLEIGYELGRIATVPVEEDELEAARRYAVGSLLLSTASQSGLASMLTTLGGAGLDVTFLRDHPLALAEVSTQDVLAAARAHLAPALLTTVLLGEAGRIAGEVAALQPVESR